MDISGIKKRDTIVLDELYDNDGEMIVDERTGDPATIEIYGIDSDQYRDALAKKMRQNNGRPGQRQRKKNDVDVTAETIKKVQNEGLELLAACTANWTGFYSSGEPLPVTVENASTLYRLLPNVKDDIDRAMADESRFFEKLPSS